MFFATAKEKAKLPWNTKICFDLQDISLNFINLALNIVKIEVT